MQTATLCFAAALVPALTSCAVPRADVVIVTGETARSASLRERAMLFENEASAANGGWIGMHLVTANAGRVRRLAHAGRAKDAAAMIVIERNAEIDRDVRTLAEAHMPVIVLEPAVRGDYVYCVCSGPLPDDVSARLRIAVTVVDAALRESSALGGASPDALVYALRRAHRTSWGVLAFGRGNRLTFANAAAAR